MGAAISGDLTSEEFGNTGQTLGHVQASDTAGMLGPHGQLGAWLTDTLGSDNTDRVTNLAMALVA